MSFYELKEIPITDLLTHLGHKPVSRAKGGRQWFYHSTLREDNNASFCVWRYEKRNGRLDARCRA